MDPKGRLVAELQEVKDWERLVPLFLAGGAFSVYESLSEVEKTDYAQLKTAMSRAFSPNCFNAFDQFVTRRCEDGEPVDIYLADLRRLAELVEPNSDDAWIRCAFVRG